MFGFLKKKLQEAIGTFSKKAEEAEAGEEQAKDIKDIEIEEQPESGQKPLPYKKKQAISAKKEKPPAREKEGTADGAGMGPEGKEQIVSQEHKEKEARLEAEKKRWDAKDRAEGEKDKVEKEKDRTREKKDKGLLKEETEEVLAPVPAKEEKKGFFGRIFGGKEKAPEKPAGTELATEEHKGLLGQISDSITKVSLSDKHFEELFWDLEMGLLENNVAMEVVEKIKADLKESLVDKKLPRNTLGKKVADSLRHSVEGLFNTEKIDIIKKAKGKKPYVIALIGINGSGKTTSIAKLAHLLKKNNLEPVIAACDTFRAAAIQQLEEHANNLGVKVIKHDYGSDPAAVAFDAIGHAKSKGKDVVLIDTAGRLHSNANLMAELEKVIRVAKPDIKIFVGESIAGNDVVEQVKLFNSKVGIDGIILAKADIDEKGGAAISVSYVTGKPILYLGTGQGYEDLSEFDKERILGQLGL